MEEAAVPLEVNYPTKKVKHVRRTRLEFSSLILIA